MNSPRNRAADPERDGLYRGFPIKRVSWGYREQFRTLLDRLSERSLLDGEERHPAQVCAPLLERLPQAGYDAVLLQFLLALDGPAGRLMRAPRLARRWRDLGADMAAERVYLGKSYFELWSDGRLPTDPHEVEFVLNQARQLMEVDSALAFSFLEGYQRVRERLSPDEIPAFIESALALHQRNPEGARAFLRLELRSAEVYAERIGRTCRLETMRGRLERIFRAVAGRGVDLQPLSALDSDELVEHRPGVVCGADHLYLPDSVSVLHTASGNRGFYLLATFVAGVCHRMDGFCAVHGMPGARSVTDVLRGMGQADPRRMAFLFRAVELRRIRLRLQDRYPGALGLLRDTARAAGNLLEPELPADALLSLSLGLSEPASMNVGVRRMFGWVDEAARCADSFRDVLATLERSTPGGLRTLEPVPPVSFTPDFDFPLEIREAPQEVVVSNLSETRDRRTPDATSVTQSEAESSAAADESRRDADRAAEDADDEESAGTEGAAGAAWLYDEWNGLEGEYYRDWCALREERPPPKGATEPGDEAARRRVDSVKRMFQRLKPDLVEKEKYLPHGDYLDIDSLVRFIARHRARTSPQVDFWIKPRISRRDMATALLMDVSGSTGKETGPRDVIGVEKEAAYVLACGLEEIGDRFGLFGFTGNGREDCRFLVYKGFGEDWGRQARQRLMGARPGASTRIGVALRHAGRRLSETSARTKLIIILTDGRPMDTGYDPNTHYAQMDVRKACEENRALGVHTFCIATDPEAAEGLDELFPAGRYVVLSDIRNLPDALARCYLQLTRG